MNTANPKYDTIARDPRIACIAPATLEESDGESGWVMVTLVEGCTIGDAGKVIAHSVGDIRRMLSEVVYAE